jgi:hypothetical protein
MIPLKYGAKGNYQFFYSLNVNIKGWLLMRRTAFQSESIFTYSRGLKAENDKLLPFLSPYPRFANNSLIDLKKIEITFDEEKLLKYQLNYNRERGYNADVVTIRFWSKGYFGHVSLEVHEKIYLSFFPDDKYDDSAIIRNFHGVESQFHSLHQDYENYGNPEVEIDLYSLDANAIISAFKEIPKDIRWSLYSMIFSPKKSHCAAMTTKLLQSGGIDHVFLKNYEIVMMEFFSFIPNAQEKSRWMIYQNSFYYWNVFISGIKFFLFSSSDSYKTNIKIRPTIIPGFFGFIITVLTLSCLLMPLELRKFLSDNVKIPILDLFIDTDYLYFLTATFVISLADGYYSVTAENQYANKYLIKIGILSLILEPFINVVINRAFISYFPVSPLSIDSLSDYKVIKVINMIFYYLHKIDEYILLSSSIARISSYFTGSFLGKILGIGLNLPSKSMSVTPTHVMQLSLAAARNEWTMANTAGSRLWRSSMSFFYKTPTVFCNNHLAKDIQDILGISRTLET